MPSSKNRYLENSQQAYFGLLAIIIVFGAIIRLYGIDFGLPELLHLDEPFEMHRALKLASGSFDFSRAGKGGFYFFIFFELSVTFIFLFVTGEIANPGQFAAFYVQNEESFYLGARIISACIGISTIYLLYIIVKKISNKRTGLMAAFFFSGATLHSLNSHFATVDITLLFFLLLFWLQIFSFTDAPNTKRAILIGGVAGLALATKLSAALIPLPMVAAVVLGLLNKKYTIKKGALFFSAMFLAFISVALILEPGYLGKIIHFKSTLGRIFGSQPLYVENTGNIPIKTVEHNFNLWHFYGKTLLKNLGLPLLIAFGLSLLLVMSTSPQIGLIFLSFLVPYFIAICSAKTDLFYARYLLPITPIFYIITSLGLNNLYITISKKLSNSTILFNSVVGLFICYLCITPFSSTVKTVIKINSEHSQITVKKWVEKNITPGATIHMEGNIEHRSQYDVPLLDTNENMVHLVADLKKTDPGKAKYLELRRQYLESINRPRYNLSLTKLDKTYPTLEQLQNSKVDYLILNISRLSGKNYANIVKEQALSRINFYKKLTESKQVHKLKEFNTDSSQNGPALAIYRF